MKVRYLSLLLLLCSLFSVGIYSQSVKANEYEIGQSYVIHFRYDDDSQWTSITDASGLVANHVYQVRFQFNPSYSFIEGHYYKLRLTFQHNAGTFSFDYAKFYTSQYYEVPLSSTVSVSSVALDTNTNQLTLDGVSENDVNRAIQRIRFFYNDKVLNDPNYTSPSIRINNVHLYVEDVTNSYVQPQINDKLSDTNNKLDEMNQKSQTIIDRLTDLPNQILHLFVPDSNTINTKIDNFKTQLSNSLGFIGQLSDMFVYTKDKITYSLSHSNRYVDLGTAEFDIGDKHFVLWQNQRLNLYPFTSWAIMEIFTVILDVLAGYGLFKYLQNLYFRIFFTYNENDGGGAE